ncbi:MAG: hypothetical protein ACHQIM_13905 [Sphingobacteriales bacterium]
MRITQIKQRLHDYIDSAEDKKLKALYTLLEDEILENQFIGNNARDYRNVKLTDEQILILQLSDKDVEAGKLISHDQLDTNDLEWLKENS